MSAVCIVFYPALIFKFPYIHLTINLGSSPLLYLNSYIILFYFSVAELFPLHSEMYLNILNTLSIVRGGTSFFLIKQLSIVFWVDFAADATIPKSPSSLALSHISLQLFPVLLAIALVKISFPTPNSLLSYSGPILITESQYALIRSYGFFEQSFLNRFFNRVL